MKTFRLAAILLLCANLAFIEISRARPATAPAPADGNDDRLTFLTLQLSSVEESIKALTVGMKAAGYKANVAADKVEGYEKGNELMDRKGGAPVPWDKFYGKTAKSFQTWWDDPVKRPKQFDYIYKANNDQAAKAKDEVAAMGRRIDLMLARRRKLEAEQSVLWATISLESIQNLEIPFQPLYRFQLKSAIPEPATAEPRIGVLRAMILFLRTADHLAARSAESVKKDQEKTLSDLKVDILAAQAALQEGVFHAQKSAELNPTDAQQAKETLVIAKRMEALAKNISEAYQLALEGDAAQDEPRKLTFRAQLQESLLAFADSTAEMDGAIKKLATAWNVKGEVGIDAPDKIPADRPASIVTATNPSSPAVVSPVPPVLVPGKVPDDKSVVPAGIPAGSARVKIISAEYGGKDKDTISLTKPIQDALDADPFMPIGAGNGWGGDPASNAHKSLFLSYQIGDTTRSVQVAEDSVCIVPAIPKEGVAIPGASIPFKIIAARWGLENLWIDATQGIRAEIVDPSQPYKIHNMTTKDVHFGKHKYLVVYYEIKGRRYVRIAGEHDSITLIPK